MVFEQVLNEREKCKKLQSWKKMVSLIYETHASCIELRNVKSSQLWTQFLQLRIEAWKIQNFNGVWTRDLMIPVRRSHQLRYEATDSGKNCIHNCKGS